MKFVKVKGKKKKVAYFIFILIGLFILLVICFKTKYFLFNYISEQFPVSINIHSRSQQNHIY